MNAIFDLSRKEFKVELSFLGFEKYYYDGKLLKKRWSFKFNDGVSFEIDSDIVEIVVSLSLNSWSMQIFKNGGLVVDELFPEFKNKVAERKKSKRMSKCKIFQNLVLWFVLVFTFTLIFQWFKWP